MASTTIATPMADGQPRNKKPAGSRRPDYAQIHKLPLPVTIEPLPPLIPHNPLSVLAILWIWLRSTVWNKSLQTVYKGVFSPETRSVHITDKNAIRALWEAGFFGKGTLSRSEPTWLDREKRRRGLLASETSEEITRKRRLERKKFKEDRARKEQEDIEAKLRQEGSFKKPVANGHLDGEPEKLAEQNDAVPVQDDVDAAEKGLSDIKLSDDIEAQDDLAQEVNVKLEDMEYLQLTLEEAFFLAYGLGILQVIIRSPHDLSAEETVTGSALFALFQTYSSFPPCVPPAKGMISPTGSFVANYAVYHHFRSLGWVIRPGPKFAVDWMLYNRGPPFSHAEFAVLTIPSYSHPFWSTERGLKIMAAAGVQNHSSMSGGLGKSWHWLHMVNRVQAQVKKTLVLAYVEMPPPLRFAQSSDVKDSMAADDDGDGDDGDNSENENSAANSYDESPTSVLQRMKVREILLRRFIPNRNRD